MAGGAREEEGASCTPRSLKNADMHRMLQREETKYAREPHSKYDGENS